MFPFTKKNGKEVVDSAGMNQRNVLRRIDRKLGVISQSELNELLKIAARMVVLSGYSFAP